MFSALISLAAMVVVKVGGEVMSAWDFFDFIYEMESAPKPEHWFARVYARATQHRRRGVAHTMMRHLESAGYAR